MCIRILAVVWILLALLVFALWFAADVSAQGPPIIGWFSIPIGPHGTVATPSRYCVNDFKVVNTYIINDVKPDRFCVKLTGPSSGAIFDLAFEITGWYNREGEPEVSSTPEYGWACWWSSQLGTLYEVGTTEIASWFVTYDIQVGYPHIDQEVFHNVEAYVGEDVYGGTVGVSYWMYDGCYPYNVYIPAILN